MIIPNMWENKKCSKPPTSHDRHVQSCMVIDSCSELPHNQVSGPELAIDKIPSLSCFTWTPNAKWRSWKPCLRQPIPKQFQRVCCYCLLGYVTQKIRLVWLKEQPKKLRNCLLQPLLLSSASLPNEAALWIVNPTMSSPGISG